LCVGLADAISLTVPDAPRVRILVPGAPKPDGRAAVVQHQVVGTTDFGRVKRGVPMAPCPRLLLVALRLRPAPSQPVCQ